MAQSMPRVVVETYQDWFTRSRLRQRRRNKLVVQLLNTATRYNTSGSVCGPGKATAVGVCLSVFLFAWTITTIQNEQPEKIVE